MRGNGTMIGTFFNVTMILVGSIIGRFLHKGIKPEFQKILTQGLGLAAMVIGINAVVAHMPNSKYPVLFIVSLAVGGLFGQWVNLQARFDSLVGKFSGGDLAEGLATAILLYCIGSLSILGPIEAALKHDYTFLFTNGIGRNYFYSISINVWIRYRTGCHCCFCVARKYLCDCLFAARFY